MTAPLYTSAEDAFVMDLSKPVKAIAKLIGRSSDSVSVRRKVLRHKLFKQIHGYDRPKQVLVERTREQEPNLEFIREGYAAGRTRVSMARECGVRPQTIGRLIELYCGDIVPTGNRVFIRAPQIPVDQERIDAVRDLYLTGHSYGEIAAALGNTTRNVVAGLVNRHCVDLVSAKRAATISRKEAEELTKVRKVAPPRPVAAPRARPTKIRVSSPPGPTLSISYEIASNPTHFTQAERCCQWPLWALNAGLHDKTVCGGSRAQGDTYCAGHMKLAYRIPDRKRAA